MYFEESKLKELFNKITDHFKEAEILFEMLPPFLIGKAKKHDSLGKMETDAEFKWGLKESRDMETWNNSIQFIEEWNYYHYHKKRWKWFGFIARLPIINKQLSCRIVHLRISET